MSTQIIHDPPRLLPLPRSASNPKPKGILKNAAGSGNQPHLQWDEENLALTEIQKDSLMKITEPKTPYVRYNAETDQIEDIPNLDLSGRYSAPNSNPASPILTASPIESEHSGPSSRRTSLSSTGRPSTGRSASVHSSTSSRSTSFSLPSDAKGDFNNERREPGEEVECEEEMDEETAAKHAAFVRARGRHYSNEAEAMKKAAKLLEEDDDSADNTSADLSMESEESSKIVLNGVVHPA